MYTYFTKYVVESYLPISSLISFIYSSPLCAEYRMTKKYVFLHVFCQQVRTRCNLPLGYIHLQLQPSSNKN